MDFKDTFYGRPSTVKTYNSLFKEHIESGIDQETSFNEWTEENTYKMLSQWENKGLARNTKITLIRLLARYIKFKGGANLDTKKFIRGLERSEQQTEVKALSSDEAARLMKFAKGMEPKFYPVMLLALHAGLRRGEIFGLRCGDIDMLNGKIKVSRSYNGPTKNGRSRIVPMSSELSSVLVITRNILLRDPEEKIFDIFDPNPTLRRLCMHAKVPMIRFHDLRHTFASLALTNNVSAKQVSTWLGHSSVTTTLDIYWNLTSEEADMGFLPKSR